jgi:hypothetical protein
VGRAAWRSAARTGIIVGSEYTRTGPFLCPARLAAHQSSLAGAVSRVSKRARTYQVCQPIVATRLADAEGLSKTARSGMRKTPRDGACRFMTRACWVASAASSDSLHRFWIHDTPPASDRCHRPASLLPHEPGLVLPSRRHQPSPHHSHALTACRPTRPTFTITALARCNAVCSFAENSGQGAVGVGPALRVDHEVGNACRRGAAPPRPCRFRHRGPLVVGHRAQ